jgi:hypothetical protein
LVDGSIQRMTEAGALVGDDSTPSLLGEEQFGVLSAFPQEHGDDMHWLREQLSKIQTYSIPNGILLHIPGVSARDSPGFETLFQPLPDGKLQGGYLELGEWDRQSDSYPWEGSVSLLLGPDGQVWASVGALDAIPEEES